MIQTDISGSGATPGTEAKKRFVADVSEIALSVLTSSQVGFVILMRAIQADTEEKVLRDHVAELFLSTIVSRRSYQLCQVCGWS